MIIEADLDEVSQEFEGRPPTGKKKKKKKKVVNTDTSLLEGIEEQKVEIIENVPNQIEQVMPTVEVSLPS